MTLDEFVDRATAWDLDAVEPTSYYFPDPPTPEYCRRLRRHAFLRGLGISGTAIRNTFTHLARAAPCAVVAQIKTEMFPNGVREEADLARVIGLLRGSGYRGFVALEYEASEDPFVAGSQPGWKPRDARGHLRTQASSFSTTFPATSVSRKSRPWKR